MRGELNQETLDEIGKQLPSIENLQSRIIKLNPGLLSIKLHPESEIPITAVCLNDVVEMMAEMRYAMHELLAHKKWYLEKNPPNKETAIWFSQYYAIDGILRLYSAAEHLAQAITFALEITLKEKSSSRLWRVCKCLKKSKPDDMITEAVENLTNDRDWKKLRKIRDDWVHNKPPMIDGLGISYDRKKRWKEAEKGFQLGFGGGDKPQYTDDELFNILNSSMILFLETVRKVLKSFYDVLKQNNISIDSEGNIPFFL